MSYLCMIITFTLQILKVYCIINGIRVQNSEFPSIVLLKFNDSFYCGASIILPKFVLTSGVCGFNKDRLEGIGIHYTDLFKPDEGDMIRLQDIIVHPRFKMGNTTVVYDIAIVILNREIEFSTSLTAIPIYEKPLRPGLICQTAGWGMVNDRLLTEEAVDKPWGDDNVIRKSVQIIVNIEICAKLINERDILRLSDETHVCARGQELKQGPSFGDFGGPLVCEGQQAAISTHSLYDKDSKYLYTVYTPIYMNEKWISEVVGTFGYNRPFENQMNVHTPPSYNGFVGGINEDDDYEPIDNFPNAPGETLSVRIRGSVDASCCINKYLILFFLIYLVRF